MTWDIIEGNWKRFKGKVNAQWGKLTDDHLDVIAGMRVELAGMIQEASPKEVSVMREEIPPRRVVLRGALAVGCSLLAPIALFSTAASSASSPRQLISECSSPGRSAARAPAENASTASSRAPCARS